MNAVADLPARRALVPHLTALPPQPAADAVVHRLAGKTMGTSWSVRVAAPARLDLARLQAGIQNQLDLVVRQMSTWAPHSTLSTINRARAGSVHALPPGLFYVLHAALEMARLSGGAFDPTAGALVNLWGFGPDGRIAAPPAAGEIARARARCGWDRLVLDTAGRSVTQPGGVYIDLSAIAKGYGVDQVARHLQGAGFRHWLVEVGGELRGAGMKPDGQPWWVALEAPDQHGRLPETVLALHELAVATSGDYRQGFVHEGALYSHTVDPRSGYPVRHRLASVTVLHRECMLADAYATALMVLGPEGGLSFARAQGLAARFITRAGNGYVETMTPAFAALDIDS